MRSAIRVLLTAGASVATAQTVLVDPYGQCGGLLYEGPWECEPEYTCSPVGTNAFPQYQCYPNTGPIVAHAFPYAQCGGQNFIEPMVCVPGWTCIANNIYFSNCVKDADTVIAADPDPDLAKPGGFCGESAAVRSRPTDCVPGFICSGPGVYGYYICLLDKSASSSTAWSTAGVSTTLVTATASASGDA